MAVPSLIANILGGNATSLVPALPQSLTNGLSTFGLLSHPELPEFLTDNPLPDGFPWGLLNTENANPYTRAPDTGVTRRYTFNVKRDTLAPDGFQKSVIVINGQFPGPQITANWGDWFEITVRNLITNPEEGLGIHWKARVTNILLHVSWKLLIVCRLLQTATPWDDGVPSVTQCPIIPGGSYTYRFRADLYGSSWYHSHSSQYSGGLFGPMVVHGPSKYKYDIDLGPVMIQDYYHTEYFEIVKRVVGPEPLKPLPPPPQVNVVPFSDNTLINGKMNYNCTDNNGQNSNCTAKAGLSKFRFKSGKTHRLRIINTSSQDVLRFSIDEHTLTVIANDLVPLKSYETKVLTLAVGQRTDVLVKATGKPKDAYWMRVNSSDLCSASFQKFALAVIYYENADPNSKPNSTAQPAPPDKCVNDDLSITEPLYKIPVKTPDTTQIINMNFTFNETGNLVWIMNNSTFRGNYNHPILLESHRGNNSYPYDPQWNVYQFGTNKTVRIVFNNLTPFPHPMHFHGHNMQILYDGPSPWDGKTIIRPDNPQRRDVQLVDGFSTFVWQFDGDNSGVWPFHCHIVWHAGAGLYVNFVSNPEDVQRRNFPEKVERTCREWNRYTDSHVVDQIDSGIKEKF